MATIDALPPYTIAEMHQAEDVLMERLGICDRFGRLPDYCPQPEPKLKKSLADELALCSMTDNLSNIKPFIHHKNNANSKIPRNAGFSGSLSDSELDTRHRLSRYIHARRAKRRNRSRLENDHYHYYSIHHAERMLADSSTGVDYGNFDFYRTHTKNNLGIIGWNSPGNRYQSQPPMILKNTEIKGSKNRQ